jgi:VWFA-related protein
MESNVIIGERDLVPSSTIAGGRAGGCAGAVAAAAALVAALVWIAPASGPVSAQSQAQQPTFRARVDSVSVDVSVTDRQGNPVTDLTADDFEIRERGKVQTIETFKLIRIDDSQDASPPRDLTSLEDQHRETARDDNRLLVIFLDDYHVRRGNAMRIRQDLARFVGQLAPRDLVALMHPLLPATAITFSRNHDATASQIMAFEGRKYDYTPRHPIEAQYQMLGPEAQEALRNESTLSALEAVCIYLGSLREGRKTVLFVSEGLSSTVPSGIRTRGAIVTAPLPALQGMAASADLFSQLRDVFVQAGRSNTSVYTLDPRGLAGSDFGIDEAVDSDADRRVLNEATDSLRTIADETDGRAIVGRNNPLPDLERMRRDLSVYYLIGYTSSLAPRDGKFHEIDVRLKQRRGLEVRARKGYWAFTAADYERATAPPKPLPPRDVLDALEDLAAVIEPSTRRPVVLYLGATRAERDNATLTFAWESTATSTTPAIDTAERVTIVAHAITGDVLFKGPVPPVDGASPPGGRVTFAAPAGSVRVQAITENARGTRIDSDSVTLDVPDFAGGGLTISTPAIYRGRTVFDLQQVRQQPSPRPAAVRAFSRSERLLLRFEVFAGGGAVPAVTMRLLNSNGDELAPLPPPARPSPSTFESEFGLGAFPPGDYLVEIQATAADQSLRRLIGIRVTG